MCGVMVVMRAQIAYEFLFVMFFLTLLFTVWITISASLQEDLVVQEQGVAVQDFSLHLQDQLYTTAQMPDGFERTFSLPVTIAGMPYSLDCVRAETANNVSFILVTTPRHSFDVQGPPMTCSADMSAPTQLGTAFVLRVKNSELEVSTN